MRTVIIAAILATAPAVLAQTPPVPAVRVQRDYQLGQRVWPADLNRDGITDLVSTSAKGLIQVSIGNGGGTFKAPVESAFQGSVVNTADFNADQRPDIVAVRSSSSGTTFALLPGTGGAALGAAVTVTSTAFVDIPFALVADFDGDGKRDLVIPDGAGVDVYPGHGDFTFGAPIQLVTNGLAADGIIADLDNDGRRDLVTANGDGDTISIFLNRGAFVFSAADIFLAHAINDVTVADLRHDGRLDLLVSAGRPNSDSSAGEGLVLVFRGNGNGTFAAPIEYPVAIGPMQIVAGDFNRDGVVDIATGNRSPIAVDDCSGTFKTWDSVSILAGRPDGTFVAARNFSIGDQSLLDFTNPQNDRYRETLLSLNTSDLNGDGAADLIASFGAILFNIPAVTNRAPTVNAGPDAVILNDRLVVLRPAASDPDEDVLTYEIRDDTGALISTYPNACYPSLHDGANRFTVTVRDRHGHSATDSVVYTVVMTNGVGSLATGTDIGQVAAAGSETYDSNTGTYTVRGSGRDIWGNADEFHFVWTQFQGDFQITTRVDSVQNVNAWTKAGIMIRENLNAGSRHASLFATPGKGVAFQRRTAENGVSVSTAGPATTAPVWLKLQRTGNVITSYYRKATTDAWTVIGAQTLTNFSSSPLVGLGVSSLVDGTVATATFSRLTIQASLPLTGRAIGTGTGSVTTDNVVYTVTGKGADIWGAADAFFYVNMRWSNDVTITARVRSLTATHPSAKAGVMVRENLTAASRHVMTVITPGRGVAMQYRSAPGGTSAQKATAAAVTPVWVRLTLSRGTNTFTSSWSSDGDHWNVLGSVNVPFAATEFFVGLPVSSHNTSTATTAVFDDVSVSSVP